ncbi:MAG: MFS transporter [bacterium]|nr:MFS transporter [bacterium]
MSANDAAASSPDSSLISEKIPWASMGLLFGAHFLVDSQVSFLSPLLPLIQEKFHLTLGGAGVLVYLISIANAGGQPLTAILVDRWPRAPWLVVGLIGSSFFLTAMGWLPYYGALVVAVPVGGFLAGLAHPDMASRAGALSARHRALSVSFFVSGGRLGFSLGPLIAIFVAQKWGMEWLWVYVVVNAVAVFGIMKGLPKPEVKEGATLLKGLGHALWKARKPASLLLGVTICRAIVAINVQGFLPTLYVERGLGLWSGGIANSILLFFGMGGVMLGGVLADRYEKKSIISFGIMLAFFSMIGFLLVPPGWGMFVLSALGVGIYMPMGVSMAFGQEILPTHRGFASALTLGASWGIASFSVVPLAVLAERVGLFQAFWALPVSLLLAFTLSRFLPKSV